MQSPAPLASAIMPTRDRRAFVARAARIFQAQDYPSLELLVLDDGEASIADLLPPDPRIRHLRLPGRWTVGDKRNRAIAEARGDYIVHWDDDDWYPPHRISTQVEALRRGADLSGTSTLHYWDPAEERAYLYTYRDRGGGRPFVAGNTLAYRRSYWERHRFESVDVGEDARFLWAGAAAARIHDHQDPDLCVATLHPGNVSPKNTSSPFWAPGSRDRVISLLGAEGRSLLPDPDPDRPLVSCVMPTADRRAFLPLALASYLAQDFPSRELLVVDDGTRDASDLLQGISGVRHLRLSARASIGHKRNLACDAARGAVIVQWDDDDWYGPSRLRLQVEPILEGRADITGLTCDHLLDLQQGQWWSPSRALHARLFHGDVHGGTLAFARRLFTAGVRYPDRSLAEDAMFLRRAMESGARLLRLAEHRCFVYMRHGRNAWAFEAGSHVDPSGWSRVERPAFLGDADLGAHRAAAGVGAPPAPQPISRPDDSTSPVATIPAKMGCRLGALRRGVSSHRDRFRPFLDLPPALDGKTFTQLDGAAPAAAPLQIRYHGPGPLHLLVPEEARESIEALDREAVREPWPPVIARRGSAYHAYRVEGAAREITVPEAVIVVGARLACGVAAA